MLENALNHFMIVAANGASAIVSFKGRTCAVHLEQSDSTMEIIVVNYVFTLI